MEQDRTEHVGGLESQSGLEFNAVYDAKAFTLRAILRRGVDVRVWQPSIHFDLREEQKEKIRLHLGTDGPELRDRLEIGVTTHTYDNLGQLTGFSLEYGIETATRFSTRDVESKMQAAVAELHLEFGHYSVYVEHRGLRKHRLIRGPSVWEDAHSVADEWDRLWAKRVAKSAAERQKEEAAERTAEAERSLQTLREVLSSSLSESRAIDWESLKDHKRFLKPAPEAPKKALLPEQVSIPDAPRRTSSQYQLSLTLLDKLISSRREEKKNLSEQLLESDTRAWEAVRDRILADRAATLEAYGRQIAEAESSHAKAVTEWEEERTAFTVRQREQHEGIDAFRSRYEYKDRRAIADYCELVLAGSQYPDCLPREFDLEFTPDTGMLVLNYRLPAPSDVPTITEVKYVQSTQSFSEKHLSEANAAQLYDDLVYQVALRTMNELLEADQAAALTGVVFNGFVTAVDKGTGNEANACIVSVQASKEALKAINLSKVDPKTCFRQLKGVGSSKLHGITPVAPILNLRREDKRFVPSHGVADTLNEGVNLAAMDWEEFEHLIREIFEKEFTSSGGEVRVTQASRDGGVDAVAFDPDPIRGGKIVIQAKRYAYTVGVSAVRDLYGTLMNEGATKGILVTTSDYGPDAYEFANGKPITLLNGSNLLHLLAKHGMKAHINLVEARQIGLGRSTPKS